MVFCPFVQPMLGHFDDVAELWNSPRDRGKRDEMGFRMAGNEVGKRGLAAAGRAPKDHGG